MVPFGLAQAPAYFQLLMNKVLEGLSYIMTYLDDIIIFSKNEEDHLRHLEEVFHRLRQAGLKMKHSKCDFFKSKIHYCHICYFESKDIPTQMTKQSFTIIYFITFKKTIHFEIICKKCSQLKTIFSKHLDTVQ